ncbi:MAG: tetratricopeptide repeat protein [Leptospirales bacterium]|jgi:tetratricopeptide (TPR) repeat protein
MESSEPVEARVRQLEEWITAAIADGNPDSALPAARDLLELHSASARAWFLLGIIEGDRETVPEDATTCLLRATELDPDFADGWVELGYAYFQVEDYRGAVRACETASRIEHGNVRAMLGRALSYQRMGDRRKAIAVLRRVKPRAGDRSLSALRLARLYYDCGHESAALVECNAVLKSLPDSIEALTLAGMIEQFDFNGDCGLSRFERLAILEPENPLHWQGLGLAQALQGKFENSRAALFMAHRLDPDDVQIRLRLGLTLLFLEEDREEGEDWIDGALADCRWRNDVDLGALFLVPLFVLRDINAPGLLEITRKLRMASHHLPEKYQAGGAGSRADAYLSEDQPGESGRDSLEDTEGGEATRARQDHDSSFPEAIPDTADYWFDAANDSLLFERRDEAILQLFRALEIHPEHPGAAAKLIEINRNSAGAGREK